VSSKLKVAVLTGGIGSEREISIQSGECVSEALKEAGFNVVTADVRPDNLDILEDSSVDVFFPALHGEFGEDGQLQQILHDKSLVYTGSGPTASKLAFDKMASKKLFAKAGVATPAAIEFNARTNINQLEKQLQYLADEYVVKPTRQGSSVGVRIITDMQEAIGAAQETFREFGDCIIEKFTRGKEITVSILEDVALPIVEIRSQTGFYDYQAKYIDERTEYLFDTIKDPALRAQIEQAAMDCFYVLGCRHFARVDFVLSDEATAYVLELNTIPGFTTHSLLPKAAAKAGFTMSELCSKIVDAAYSPLLKCRVPKVK
jgi:D-alanine-D-alanine ligase